MEWKIDLSKYNDSRIQSRLDGKTIKLLTVEELKLLKLKNSKETLISIFGKLKQVEDCDEDDRSGYVAYGRLIK